MEGFFLRHAARLAAKRPLGKFPRPLRDREPPAPGCRTGVQDNERLLTGHPARKGVYICPIVRQHGAVVAVRMRAAGK